MIGNERPQNIFSQKNVNCRGAAAAADGQEGGRPSDFWINLSQLDVARATHDGRRERPEGFFFISAGTKRAPAENCQFRPEPSYRPKHSLPAGTLSFGRKTYFRPKDSFSRKRNLWLNTAG